MHAYEGQTFEDIFSTFSDLFGGDVFGEMLGRAGRRGRGPRRGMSLERGLNLTFEEAAFGCKKTIDITRNEICGTCSGSGAAPGSTPANCPYCRGLGEIQQSQGFFTVRTTCPRCRGKGTIIEKACPKCSGSGRIPWRGKIDVTIPPGVEDGQTLRLENEGEPGDAGAPRGDLYIHLSVQEHPIFERHGADLIMQKAITPSQAALGHRIDIPLLNNKTASLKIEPGTQSGQVYNLKGEGIARLRGSGKGDLLVQVVIRTPKKMSAEQEALYKRLLELETKGQSNPHQKGYFDRLKGKFVE